ncbi:hypothetical protein [Pseudoxanthomonas mexicana]
MESLEFPCFATGTYADVLDAFFQRLDTRNPESFFMALSAFDGIDVSALAADHVIGLARRFFAAKGTEREKLAEYMPYLGHVRIASRRDVSVSFSVRSVAAIDGATMTTSTRNEFHRIVKGSLELIECRRDDDPGKDYRPATSRTLDAGDEFMRRAGESAYVLRPIGCGHTFSISGWSEGHFTSNVDAATGRVISQAFASPDDCILSNVLELCALDSDAVLAKEALSFTTHDNHRIRLSAFKAAAAGGAIDARDLAEIASRDRHPTIRKIGIQMMEATA